MKLIKKSLLLVFIISALLFGASKAQSADEKASTPEDTSDDTLPVTDAPTIDDDVEFDENGLPKLKPHPDIDAVFKFTKPDGLVAMELPSAQEVQFLIGVKNNGKKDFIIETIDASLRYPQDFSVNIQNFTSYAYNRVVKPSQEVTLAYSLMISEIFNERSFGFLVNLLYKDQDGKLFSNAVFNQTMDIIEINDGLNGEILFVYVFLISLVGLIVFAIYQYFFARRFSGRSKRKVETGTATDKIDYDWIPSQNLNEKNSPKPTPKGRKAKKAD